MTPQHDRCVLTRHDVQSIKDLVFIVGGNSESSAQKAIFEILSDNMRRSRPHPAAEQPVNGCWYYDHNVCGLPHPSPTADAHDAAIARKAREDVLKQIKQHLIDEYHYPDVEDWLIEELMSYIQNNIESTQQQAGEPK